MKIKVLKEETKVYLADGLRSINLPAGLLVRPATNLPEDSKIKYWLEHLPRELKLAEVESHHRNIGFGFEESEVREALPAEVQMYLQEDYVAELIGKAIAKELGLKKNQSGLFDLVNGTKSYIGLARTIERIIVGEWEYLE